MTRGRTRRRSARPDLRRRWMRSRRDAERRASRASWRCSRLPPSRLSGPRCCRTCARRRRRGHPVSTATRLGVSATVAEGSATVALKMAEGLGDRIHYATPVTGIRGRAPPAAQSRPTAASAFTATPSSAPCPSARFAGSRSTGVSPTPGSPRSTASGTRWPPRRASPTRLLLGGRGPQRHGLHGDDDDRRHLAAAPEGVISTLIPPERLAALLTTSPRLVEGELTAELVAAFGDEAANPPASTSGAGGSTRGRSATSPAGARAT